MQEVGIGRAFIKAVTKGNVKGLEKLIEMGANVSYQDGKTGMTALHYAAGYRDTNSFKALINSGQCNYLIRDNLGRLPSELAYVHGNHVAMARLLGIRERLQASEEGIQLTRRPS